MFNPEPIVACHEPLPATDLDDAAAWHGAPLRMGDTLERTHRVLPNDVDVNGHMNNVAT
jgi:acyl-ACP thioesterase